MQNIEISQRKYKNNPEQGFMILLSVFNKKEKRQKKISEQTF